MRGQRGRVGRSARLSIGSVDVVISQDRSVLVDREQFRLFGIDPEQKDLLVVKAYNHFRADFEPVGRGLMYVDTGGIFSFDFGRFQYQKARRPIFPLDNCHLEECRTLRACSKRRVAWE